MSKKQSDCNFYIFTMHLDLCTFFSSHFGRLLLDLCSYYVPETLDEALDQVELLHQRLFFYYSFSVAFL